MRKDCPTCGLPFETVYFQKAYCSQRCRRTAKDRRASERDAQGMVEVSQGLKKMTSPTVQQLAAFALLYAARAETEPRLFDGDIPDFTPPTGVMWIWSDDTHTKRMMGINDMPAGGLMKWIEDENKKAEMETGVVQSRKIELTIDSSNA